MFNTNMSGACWAAAPILVMVIGGMLAPEAAADYDAGGYINALDKAGLIDHDGKPCNFVNGVCHGQFPDAPAALQTGIYVCRQVQNGRTRASIVNQLSHGEGLLPSAYNAPIIYDAATAYLC